jgi:nitrogen fixation protein FixH
MIAAVARPSSRSLIPWLFGAFFLVIIGVNATMVWFAVGSFPGLVTDRAYQAGLTYNRNLEAAAAQARLGWQVDLEAQPLAEGPTAVSLQLRDRDGVPLAGASVTARFQRPVETADDLFISLDDLGQGHYAGQLALPRRGVWDIHLVARRGADLFAIDRRMTVP